MEFLTQGQKLKRLRVQLKLKQKDLADENITREFISMVEKGRRNFSRQNSLRIMKRILAIAEEKGIGLDPDEEYIARDIKGDVQKYCIDRVEAKASFEECQELLALSDEYEVPYAKSKILKRMGDVLFLDQNYEQAFINYSKALDVLNTYNISGDRAAIFNNMGVSKLKLLHYEEAALYYSNAISLSEYIKDYKTSIRASMNLILIYCSQNKFEDAKKMIERCILLLEDGYEDFIYLKLKVLEAYCYDAEGNYDQSLSIYYDLENRFTGNPSKEEAELFGNIFNNMGNILAEQKRYEESELYFDKSYNYRSMYDKNLIQRTMILKSEMYINRGYYDKAEALLKESIDLCKLVNDYEYWFKALKLLEGLYSITKDLDSVKWIYTHYIELSLKNENDKIAIYAYNKLINLELERNNYEEAQRFCLQLNKYIEDVKVIGYI